MSRRKSWNTFVDLKHSKQPQSQALSPLLGDKRERVWERFYASSLCLSPKSVAWGRTQRRRNTSKRWVMSAWAWYAKPRAASSTGVERRKKCLPVLTHPNLFWFLPPRIPQQNRDCSQTKNDLALRRTQKGSVVVLWLVYFDVLCYCFFLSVLLSSIVVMTDGSVKRNRYWICWILNFS